MEKTGMIAARRLTVQKQGKTLLSEINLTLTPGELTVIVGPNGAGKSTLLQALSGQLSIQGGSVTLCDRDIVNYTRAQRAQHIAHLSQHIELCFDLTVSEVVMLGRYAHTLPYTAQAAAVDRALRAVDLLPHAQQSYSSLSGGERQRVQLARILAQIDHESPNRWLFLDEHGVHLDIAHQHHIFQLLRQLTTVGIVAVLHDFNLALRYADRVILLTKGKILADGAPQAVLTPSNIQIAFGMPVQLIQSPEGSTWIIPET